MRECGYDGGMGDHPGHVEFDDDGRVSGDFACCGCRYNLRGIMVSANCPECGVTISRTVETARQQHLAAIRRAHGAAWLIAADLGVLLLTLIAADGPMFVVLWLHGALILGSVLAGAIGLWFVCEPIGGVHGDGVRRMCYAVRAAIIVGIVAFVMMMLGVIVHSVIDHVVIGALCAALFASGGGMFVLTHAPDRAPLPVRIVGIVLCAFSVAAIFYVMTARGMDPLPVRAVLFATGVVVMPLLWWCRRQVQ